MQNLLIGHQTCHSSNTGLSVFLFQQPVIAAYHLCGASPATFDISVLNMESNTTHIDALVFTGGSTQGLPATLGVMRWLIEQNRGWPIRDNFVPIVPAAAIYDLRPDTLPPTADDAYQACTSAHINHLEYGRIGAGTGATIGKLIPHAKPMTGGIGFKNFIFPNGVEVLVYAVVNCVGDVINNDGSLFASGRDENGNFLSSNEFIRAGNSSSLSVANTTLIALFTNAKFSRIELKRISQMVVAGIARAISPIFTRFDGDIIFSISLGELSADELAVGQIGAELTRDAILHAVQDSKIVRTT